jgi:beta-phosphoglucomutase-like phosphatase (HAD superfamily)
MRTIPDIKKYKGIMFDLDGTLIDSNGIWEKADIEVLKSFGILIECSLKKEQRKFLETCSAKNVFIAWAEYLINKFNLKNTTAAEIRQQELDYAKRFLPYINYKADADKILLYIKDLGIKTAIVTQSAKESMDIIINSNENIKRSADIKKFFDVIITSDMIKKRKPAPDGYLSAMKKLKLQPSECLVFEDNLVGAAAAKDAGCDVCIIYDEHSNKDREQLEKMTPYHISSFLEFIK